MNSPLPQTELFSKKLSSLLDVTVCDADMLSGVDLLASEFGSDVYREMLQLLTGKHFDAELAMQYWQGAIRHCHTIFKPEYALRGFRPALMDYLRYFAGEFADARIIEGDYLYNITRLSITDGLTGLYNQTYFKKILGKTIHSQRRVSDSAFALVLLDLDRFKQYNDRCGHLHGDEALRQCARIITASLREGDIAVRYGGEEFALLLPHLDRHSAFKVAERIRIEIEAYNFPKRELLDSGALTVSGGIAVFPESGETVDDLIQAADKELYKAKERRNCIYSFFNDRRKKNRRPVRSLVEYASIDGALYRPALSTDISETGMGLGCEGHIAEGMRLSLRLTRPYWPENIYLSAKVRQVRRKDEVVFVGLEFEQTIDALQDLLLNKKMSLVAGAA